jgi:hypothetical protein
VFLTLGYATEWGVPLPGGDPPPRLRPEVEYTLSLDGSWVLGLNDEGRGTAAAVGANLGLPFGSLLELRARADLLMFAHVDGQGATQLTTLAGLRAGRWFPVFLEVSVGYGASLGSAPNRLGSGVVLDAFAGVHMANLLDCGVGGYFGVRYRDGLGERNDALRATFLTVGVDYDNLVGARECHP